MKVDLVPFELVKKLVEKGFNEPTLFQYGNTGKLTDIIVEEGYRGT